VQFLSADDLGGFEVIPARALEPVRGQRGFLAQYFSAGQNNPAVTRVEPNLNFMWEMRTPDEDKVKPGNFRARFTGRLIPPVSGTYTLRVTVGGGSAWVGGSAPLAVTDADKGNPSATATVQLQAGQPFTINVNYDKHGGDGACRLEWALPADDQKMALTYAKLTQAAQSADAVLVFGGIDNSLDTEGRDRTDMEFPPAQSALIEHLAAVNPKTIVTLLNGSPLEIGGWLSQVPAVLEAWYPGMEGGTAIANVLFGKVTPSGKLPFTWPRQLADSPAHALGKESADRVDYLEGDLVGYRYFDTRQVVPQFPFGYGLSYTTFCFQDLSVKPDGDGVKLCFKVQNTGRVAGAEVAQVYVHPPAGMAERPVHELKGFKRVFLQPGEWQMIEITLPGQAFAYFDEPKNGWVVPRGRYVLEVGDSSGTLPLTAQLSR
jgi:beta-glucosidase